MSSLPLAMVACRDPASSNVPQIVTVDKGFLSVRIGRIDPASMDLVEDGLRRVLGL